MNVNTRAKTITASVSEKRWLDEVYAMGETVGCQSFVDGKQIAICDKLQAAVRDFKELLTDLGPKKTPEPAAKS
jgi:hypothetical protein